MKLEATVFALATAIAIDDDSGTAALRAIDIVHGDYCFSMSSIL